MLAGSALGKNAFITQFCGAVQISSTAVATAAHCINGRSASSIYVIAGFTNVCLGNANPTSVSRVVDFSKEGGPDLAILRIDSSPTAHPKQTPIQTDLSNGELLTAYGWGSTTGVDGMPSCYPTQKTLRVVGLMQELVTVSV